MTESLIDLGLVLPRHPAKYTNVLFPVFCAMLKGSRRVLDPFSGTGKIFELQPFLHGATIEAVEIEPEWAAYHPMEIEWPTATRHEIAAAAIHTRTPSSASCIATILDRCNGVKRIENFTKTHGWKRSECFNRAESSC